MNIETRKFIIETATVSFLSAGYDKTSLNDIVKKCGVTKGAFYHYFKTKDELFLEVINSMFAEIEKWFAETVAKCTSFREFLYSYFNYPSFFAEWSGSMGISVNMYRMIFDAVDAFPFLRSKISDSYRGFFGMIEERVKEAQKAGEVREDINAENFAIAATVLIEGFILFEVLLENENSISDRALKIADDLWEKIRK